MKHLALISLALAACIDTPPATSTSADELASSVYPHQWTTTMPGMSTFWPTNATSVQVLITDGDRENRQDTFYAWVIADGRSVFTVLRVDKFNRDEFMHDMRGAFDEAESLMPQRFDSITGSVDSGPPSNPPHIGGGGNGGGPFTDGYFPQALVRDALVAAGSIRTATLTFFDANVTDGYSM